MRDWFQVRKVTWSCWAVSVVDEKSIEPNVIDISYIEWERNNKASIKLSWKFAPIKIMLTFLGNPMLFNTILNQTKWRGHGPNLASIPEFEPGKGCLYKAESTEIYHEIHMTSLNKKDHNYSTKRCSYEVDLHVEVRGNDDPKYIWRGHISPSMIMNLIFEWKCIYIQIFHNSRWVDFVIFQHFPLTTYKWGIS